MSAVWLRGEYDTEVGLSIPYRTFLKYQISLYWRCRLLPASSDADNATGNKAIPNNVNILCLRNIYGFNKHCFNCLRLLGEYPE